METKRSARKNPVRTAPGSVAAKPSLMDFKKGTGYSQNIRRCLNEAEEQALWLLLATDPFIGVALTDAPVVLEFGPFCNHYVYYVVGKHADEVIFLDISKSKVKRFSPEEKKEASDWVRILKEEVIRKGLETILNIFR
jgi:hypothetical protein